MVTVLVVDDSHVQRELISEVLNSHGMKVIEATDGLEAQKILKSTVPDMVITDLIMPEMNGYELCRWIKNNPDTQKIPVLICSTKSEEFDRYWGMKQGADAYLTKPFSGAELFMSVKHLLSGN